MVKIPDQLQQKDIGFVLLGEWDKWINTKTHEVRTFKQEEYALVDKETWKPLGKTPFEKAWQKNPYHYSDSKIIHHSNNFGVIGGYGNLRIIDIDDPSLYSYFKEAIGKTYTVQTGSGGYHIYIYSNYNTNHVFIGGKGEVRAKNYQVVSAPSRHPNGKDYTIIDPSTIKTIPEEILLEIIKPYLRISEDSEVKKESEPERDTSRSGEEMSAICKMILKGWTQEQCYEKMKMFSKWTNGSQQYRDATYNKAVDYVYSILRRRENNSKIDETQIEKSNNDAWNEALYFDKDLKDYVRPQEEYFIEGLIPKESIGLFCGYSGVRKTYFMLGIALSVASGKTLLENYPTKEKCRVLIIDEENGKSEIDKRVKSIKKGMGIENESLEIAYLSFFNAKFDLPSKQQKNQFFH